MELSRRRLLVAAGAAGLGAGFGISRLGGGRSAVPPAVSTGLPRPADSGIDHVVVLMMENRSFDHLLGWVPGADGRQAGLQFRDDDGVAHPTFHLQDFQGCASPDPDHSKDGGLVAYNGGRCDGWLRAGENDLFTIGYYQAADLDFWRQAAGDWTVCDRYFSPTMSETYPNRIFQHAGQTDRLHNTNETSSLPTIWDRLAEAGLRGRYYFCDTPFAALWGAKYRGISRPFEDFLADCASGDLPEVAFVDPPFTGDRGGVSAADHPHADIRAGETFLAQVYNAVVTGPAWPRTMFVINYDEWGGFFDHVPPTSAPDRLSQTALRGFRVPAAVISPRSRRGAVAHGVYDHTSVLRTIEWRWGLRPLAPRDEAAANLAEVLDFRAAPRLVPPAYSVPPMPAAPQCADSGIAVSHALLDKAREHGWQLP
jgi:phospholipase C